MFIDPGWSTKIVLQITRVLNLRGGGVLKGVKGGIVLHYKFKEKKMCLQVRGLTFLEGRTNHQRNCLPSFLECQLPNFVNKSAVWAHHLKTIFQIPQIYCVEIISSQTKFITFTNRWTFILISQNLIDTDITKHFLFTTGTGIGRIKRKDNNNMRKM